MGTIVSMVRKAADVHDVHVDVPLSNISTAYIQSETAFIAGQVFPVVPVGKKSDRYIAYDKETFFRNRAKKWVPGTPMPQGAFNVDNTPNYSCEFRAFEYPLGWDIRDNADSVLQFDRVGSEFVTRALLLEREIGWATTYFNTGVWGKDLTGVASNPQANQFIQWSDYANSDPIGDYRKARLAIHQNTGFAPNTTVMSQEVFETLADHPLLKELYKYTQASILTPELVARALRVEKLVIASAVQITSPEGAAVESYDWIYGKRAWLGYVNPSPSLLMPSSGYIFNWRGMTQGFEVAIERHSDARQHADFVQGITCYDMKRVGADLGVLFDQAVD
jgi:hypothetical protein